MAILLSGYFLPQLRLADVISESFQTVSLLSIIQYEKKFTAHSYRVCYPFNGGSIPSANRIKKDIPAQWLEPFASG